jgi:DNA recombination protein Rad52
MSGFSDSQLKALAGKLKSDAVRTRQAGGKSLHYIEGWFAVSQANAIFGFAGWDREIVHFERAYERLEGQITHCAYIVRVRLRVRAGATDIVREGSGFGAGAHRSALDAHERALKTAETDATKRALSTFGNRFGLCLYDRCQAGLASAFDLTGPDGAVLAPALSAEAFCGGLRQLIETARTAGEVQAMAGENAKALASLRERMPGLCNAKGEHYADLIALLVQRRKARLQLAPQNQDTNAAAPADAPCTKAASGPVAEPAPANGNPPPEDLAVSRIGTGPRIDKGVLILGHERRFRDKAHLRLVGARPCLICDRQPCHAHHLKFAQARGLSQKVSDEFTVPLCVIHHNELHRAASETEWWARYAVDPLPIAEQLWHERNARKNGGGEAAE